jgi:CrcB protein
MTNALWFRLLCVALAGAAGSLARWGVSHASQSLLGHRWPYGTLAVNLLGCFLFGVVIELSRDRVDEALLRLVLLTGLAGAFTTFSTFAFDTWQLHHDRGLGWAGLNMALHLTLGLASLVLGLAAGRALA